MTTDFRPLTLVDCGPNSGTYRLLLATVGGQP